MFEIFSIICDEIFKSFLNDKRAGEYRLNFLRNKKINNKIIHRPDPIRHQKKKIKNNNKITSTIKIKLKQQQK